MIDRTAAFAAAVAVVLLGLTAGTAEAQLMGNKPYSFQARDQALAAQAQMQNRSSMVVNQYYSLSTSVGNMTQVTQTVGAGATATIGMNQTQTNKGQQNATAQATLNDLQALTQPHQ